MLRVHITVCERQPPCIMGRAMYVILREFPDDDVMGITQWLNAIVSCWSVMHIRRR